jgi:glycosyltransferase involved in cell wall biosynthesis
MTAHDLKIACPSNKMLTGDGICERCKVGRYYQTVLNRCIHRSLVASSIIAAESYLHRWLQSYQNNVDRMIVPSRFFIEKFVEWGWPRDNFTYVPNFVDASEYEPNFRAGCYLVYFGRLSVEKGVETLIRAAAAAGVPLKIVGTGPIEKDLKELAKNLSAPVEFMGYRTGSELQDLVRESRAAVLPSECYENAPICVLERFALGKPAIGANIGGIPEMIRQDETGWLFESGDIDALAGIIDKVSSASDAEVEELGQRARTLVEKEFSPVRYIDAITEVYSSLRAQSNGRRSATILGEELGAEQK